MKSKKNMPNTTVLNSKWQMLLRKYSSSISVCLWALLVLASAVSSIVQGASVLGGVVSILGLAILVLSAAYFLVARNSPPRYDLSEWSKAVREQHGDHAVIVLNAGGSVTVDANGQTTEFATATDVIRVAS